MKLVVFGASGRIGRLVVEYAAAAGHEVRAIVRDALRAPFRDDVNVHVVVGDVFEPVLTESAVRGADAVVSALGNRVTDEIVTLRTDATRQIVRAMDVHGVHRLVIVGSADVLPADGDRLRGEAHPRPGYDRVFADHRDGWLVAADSGLDWTLACPAEVRDGERTRHYRRQIDGLPEGGLSISVGDVADFVVDAVRSDDYHRTRVGLAY